MATRKQVERTLADDTLLTGDWRQGPTYQLVRPGGTRDWLLILTLAGAGRVTHAGGDTRTTRNDLILLRPGTRHDYGTAPDTKTWRLLWTHFVPRPGWIDWLVWPELSPGVHRLRLTKSRLGSSVRTRLADVHRLATGNSLYRIERAMNALEDVLLRLRELNATKRKPIDERVDAAIAWINRRLTEPITVRTIAEACDSSASRLAHLFKSALGVPPMQYVERERLQRARQLLRGTTTPIQTIALQVGFASPFYFSLRFKRRFGVAPTAYRCGSET